MFYWAIICIIAGALAARKGYNFFLWVLAGGIIGLLILAFLPHTQKLPEDKRNDALKKGNTIGSIISVIVVIVFLISTFFNWVLYKR